MFISCDVCRIAKLQSKAQVFLRIVVEIEAESIEPFFAKCI